MAISVDRGPRVAQTSADRGPRSARTSADRGLLDRGPWVAGDYMLRAALVVTHFFLGENRHAPKMTHFWFYCNSPNGYAHSNCTAILMVDSKSYCTVFKTYRDETSQVTDPSP